MTTDKASQQGVTLREAQEAPFEKWWEEHGQYSRSGGGQYEKTFAWNAWCAALPQPPAPEQANGEPDMRAICEALGFDPTNHHNAAKCPYCRPATPTAEPGGEAVARYGMVRRAFTGNGVELSDGTDLADLLLEQGTAEKFDLLVDAALAASPAAPVAAKPELSLRWCENCGEGVTNFCRGDGNTRCPSGFDKLVQAAKPEQQAQVGEPSKDQMRSLLDGLDRAYVLDSRQEFLRVWIRDWTAAKMQSHRESIAKKDAALLACVEALRGSAGFEERGNAIEQAKGAMK